MPVTAQSGQRPSAISYTPSANQGGTAEAPFRPCDARGVFYFPDGCIQSVGAGLAGLTQARLAQRSRDSVRLAIDTAKPAPTAETWFVERNPPVYTECHHSGTLRRRKIAEDAMNLRYERLLRQRLAKTDWMDRHIEGVELPTPEEARAWLDGVPLSDWIIEDRGSR